MRRRIVVVGAAFVAVTLVGALVAAPIGARAARAGLPGQAGAPVGGAPVGGAAAVTVIRNVTVIDVVAGRGEAGRDVTIEGERIARIEPAAPPPPERDVDVIDGTGKYLIPGLFDAHVHYVEPETFGRLMLANGVLFVRDMGGVTAQVVELRDRLNRGELPGPEMIVTGAIIDGKPPVWPFSEACETPEEAREAVRRLKAAGVDQVKVYSRLKRDVYLAAVDEARAQGLKAVGHLPVSCTMEDAIAAGQRSIEHLTGFEGLVASLAPEEDAAEGAARPRGGIFAGFAAWGRMPRVDRAALGARLRRLAEADVVQCPTLVVMAGISGVADAADDTPGDARLAYVPEALRLFWGGEMYRGLSRPAAMALPHMKAMVGALHAAGVPIMVGTDLANPYVYAGFSVHDELGLLVECGLSPAEALRAATATPAAFVGMEGRLGQVRAGMAASVVLLDADPLADIRHTARIDSVFLRGRRLDRAALDGLLREAREHAAGTAAKGADAPVALEAPGEVIARGRYRMSFTVGGNTFPAGSEEFLITRDDEGYHAVSHVRPRGGPQKPCVVRMTAAPDGTLRSATYRELTEAGLEATYVLEDGRLASRATRHGAQQGTPQEAEIEVGGDAMISGPSIGPGFLSYVGERLAVGERRSVTGVTFGYQGWRPQSAPVTISREADEPVARPGGGTVVARVYTSEVTTPAGAMRGKTWVDGRGVVLRSTLAMPFGTSTAELE